MKTVFDELIQFSISSLGLMGGIFIVYGYLSSKSDEFKMPWIEKHGESISNWLTAISTFITIITIYIKGTTKPGAVWPLSKIVTGPIVLIITCKIIIDLAKKRPIPKYIIVGLALVAIAGTLIRVYKTSVLYSWLIS